jgi:hypothetical protein
MKKRRRRRKKKPSADKRMMVARSPKLQAQAGKKKEREGRNN